jgi:CheY-like chemotaxis protein
MLSTLTASLGYCGRLMADPDREATMPEQGDEDEPLTVLLVEDDEGIREMYELKLTLDGYRVITATDGDQGVTLAKAVAPDIIFLDIRLPKKDGFEVLIELRADPTTADIPVIILSNYGDEELVDRGLRLGAKEYLLKMNVTPAHIAHGIDEWIGR